jgi:hypothetical protein
MEHIRTDDALPAALGRRAATLLGYGAKAILHIHPLHYRPFGTGFPRAGGYGSSEEDRKVSNRHKIPNYIGTAGGLLVYRHDAKRDERLMGSGWWKKDCF